MNLYKASFSQYLIWLDQLTDKQSAKYNIGGYSILQGNLSYIHFQEAVLSVLKTQDIYSTMFSFADNWLYGQIRDAAQHYSVEVVDFSGQAKPEEAAMNWMQQDFAQAFELENQYLFHFALLKVSETKHFWYAKAHHIITDGWSFKLLLNQTAAFYAQSENGSVDLTTSYSYKDYAEDDNDYWNSERSEADRNFWEDKYRQLPEELFQKISNSADGASLSKSKSLTIGPAVKDQLQSKADEYKVSIFQLIVGYILIFFSKYQQEKDIALGIPVLNRTKKIYRSTAGVFMNLLALRFNIESTDSVESVMTKVKANMRGYLRHQRFQYGKLLQLLGMNPKERSVYQIRISYEDFAFTSDFGNLQAEAVALSNHSETDPLSIYFRDYHEEGFDIRFVYNTEYFDDDRMDSIIDGFHYKFSTVALENDPLVKDFNILSNEKHKEVVRQSIGIQKERSYDNFAALWQSNLAKFKDRVALSTAMHRFTYEDLHRNSQQVAHLLHLHGRASNSRRVGLFLPRSEYMVSGMLGAIMAGYTYVPLEQDDPEERIAFILSDASCDTVLTTRSLMEQKSALLPDHCQVLFIDELEKYGLDNVEKVAPVGGKSLDASYIIYTSGSTGKPKGVTISNRSMIDYCQTAAEYFDLRASDVALQQASFGFDTSVEEIFPILLAGGRLHILENRKDLVLLKEVVENQQITFLSTSPLVVRFLNEFPPAPALRILISGGDLLRYEYIDRLIENDLLSVYNTYGPTESTVCATYHKVQKTDTDIPIGKPITNRSVFILNEDMQIQPWYGKGEIYIAGEGLAMQYLNQENLTKDKFLPHPLEDAKRIYRTGDIGFMDIDGQLYFSGRKDEQISFRGYRIESEEVERALEEIDEVQQALVLLKNHNEIPNLVAFLTLHAGRKGTPEIWTKNLSTKLPAYMIPSFYKVLDQFPMLSSGKIDKKRLHQLDLDVAEATQTEEAFLDASTDSELQKIWKKLLPVDRIKPSDSFFQLGGNSIAAASLIMEIRKQLRKKIELKDVFEYQTFSSLANFLKDVATIDQEAGIEKTQQTSYPLTHAQERIWLLSQIEEASIAYHITGAIALKNNIRFELLKKAIQQLINRHQSLRTIIKEDQNGAPYQLVMPTLDGAQVLSYTKNVEDEQAAKSKISVFCSEPFDMETGPLFRLALLEFKSGAQLLVYAMHHIIADGWSFEVLAKELTLLYDVLLKNAQFELPPLQYQFHDFIPQIIEAGERSESEAYWVEKFKNEPEPTLVPTQKNRSAFKTFVGEELSHTLDEALFKEFKQFCGDQGGTVFIGLFALLNTLLYKYTHQSTSVIGTPVANRDLAEKQDQIGLFLNTLPIKTDFKDSYSFADLFDIQKNALLEAFLWNNYPFDKLLQQLPYTLDRSRSPLFDILIVLHNQSISKETQSAELDSIAGKLEFSESFEVPKKAAQFDLTFAFYFVKDQIQLRLEYNTDLFEAWFIRQMISHFEGLMRAVLLNPNAPLHALEYRSPLELETIKAGGFAALEVVPESITQQFLAIASQHPTRTAITTTSRELTYQELESQARQMAYYLKFRCHVSKGDRVAVLLETSELIPVSMLAIWLIGGVYVPINVSNPRERIALILEKADCSAVIDQELVAGARNTVDYLNSTEIQHFESAYILFTSGTTGIPKGVQVSQKGISNKIHVENSILDIEGEINTCFLTNYSFDVSFLELLPPLVTGGKIVVPPANFLDDFLLLYAMLTANDISVLHGTPTFLDALFKYMPPNISSVLNENLKCIGSGGESLNEKLVEQIKQMCPSVNIHNLYGPTEAIIHATAKTNIERFPKESIGLPMQGVRAYILDKYFNPVPKGVVGELFVGGKDSLAEGYVELPEETSKRFIQNPYFTDEKIYKTGDLVRWTHDGEIEFIGRADQQIKIRGFRVELGEVRQTLERHPDIQQAVVTTHGEASNLVLAAYFISENPVQTEALSAYLSRFLPNYMVPSQIVQVSEIPVNNNGKIDFEQLISQSRALHMVASHVNPARHELDEKLITIWQNILQLDQIGIENNFFELGGNSILLVRLRAELNQEFGILLNMKDLLQTLTIRQLSDVISVILSAREKRASEESNELKFEEFTL